MVSLQKAQTGARVYRGVGQSPNMGQVSAKGAQGYIQREQRNKTPVRPIGRDGKSDSRSGVAAQALKRQGKAAGPKHPKPKPAPSRNGGSPVAPAAAPPPQQVTVSNTGLLELPYDQSYASDQYSSVADANQALLDLQMEEQQNDLEYAQATRDTDLQHQDTTKKTLSGAGGSGTVFSSQYGNQVASNATSYANRLADLTSKNSQFKSNAALRRAAIQSALAQQLAASTQEYGDELGDEAGTLGYDTTPVPVNGAQASIRAQANRGTGWGTVSKNKGSGKAAGQGGGGTSGSGKPSPRPNRPQAVALSQAQVKAHNNKKGKK